MTLETSIAGVFAAGDVRQDSIKRVASAVGEGATVVRLVHDHLRQDESARAATISDSVSGGCGFAAAVDSSGQKSS